MKTNRAYDARIALEIMDEKLLDVNDIPYFSSNIYDAYQIINRLEDLDWYCSVGEKISNTGDLYYWARFYKDGYECLRMAHTIPMAICDAAMAVIGKEYVKCIKIPEITDEVPISISGTKTVNTTKIIVNDSELLGILKTAVDKEPLEAQNFENVAKEILDLLAKNGYVVIRKDRDI